jgi:signal transduction histidine kinase
LGRAVSPLYAYSLVPVLAVAFLLFFTGALRGRNARGLAMYCLAVGLWSAMLLCIYFPATVHIGQRLAASGAFIAAGFLHAAYEVTGQKRYGLVWVAYLVAAAITVTGVLQPGALYDPSTLKAGPFFAPAMALAIITATVPFGQLARAYRYASPERQAELRALFISGILGYTGGMSNTLLLSRGVALPFGIFLVLGSLFVIANVIRAHEPPSERRLLERSLLYSALAAFLSAGFLFGVLSLMSAASEPLLTQYKLGAFVLLCMAAIAFEPVRQQIQEYLGRRFFKGRAPSADLARELAIQEAKADHAGRLAEIGTFATAVAHEVRNPLGVLAAHLSLLERQGARGETVTTMREQITRATRFVDDLLRYGRPRPLELRMTDLCATADLALSTARQALGAGAPQVDVHRDYPSPPPLIEADQAQLSQVLIVLMDNALRALSDVPVRKLSISIRSSGGVAQISVDDSGPGIPPEVAGRLFQPFVTGRKRDGPNVGTGLGLAIARTIVERHSGRLTTAPSALAGARFEIELPTTQAVLAAAVSSAAQEIVRS